MRKLETIVRFRNKKRRIKHCFFPALAIQIGLDEGIMLEKGKVSYIRDLLKSRVERGYLRWSSDYPFDYDNTIVARNVLNLLGEKIESELELSFSKEGGVYTYIGGLRSKPNNSVDLLINLNILNYLRRNCIKSKAYIELRKFLKNQRKRFAEPVTKISRYYLSEGYLLYCLSKVAEDIDIDIRKLYRLKERKIEHPTDKGLALLALDRKEELSSGEDLFELFQHPRLNLRFSCEYFDEVIRRGVNNKLYF